MCASGGWIVLHRTLRVLGYFSDWGDLGFHGDAPTLAT